MRNQTFHSVAADTKVNLAVLLFRKQDSVEMKNPASGEAG